MWCEFYGGKRHPFLQEEHRLAIFCSREDLFTGSSSADKLVNLVRDGSVKHIYISIESGCTESDHDAFIDRLLSFTLEVSNSNLVFSLDYEQLPNSFTFLTKLSSFSVIILLRQTLLSLPSFLSPLTLASSSLQCHSHASLGCSGILVQPDDVENIQRIAVEMDEPSSSSSSKGFLSFVSLDIAPPLCRFQAIDFLLLNGKLPMVRLFDDRNLDYLSELKSKYGRNSELEILVKSLVQVGAIVVVPLPLFSIPLMDLVSPFVHRKTFVSLTKVYRFILKEEDLHFIIDESFELETRESRTIGLLRKELQENPLPRQLTSAVSPT